MRSSVVRGKPVPFLSFRVLGSLRSRLHRPRSVVAFFRGVAGDQGSFDVSGVAGVDLDLAACEAFVATHDGAADDAEVAELGLFVDGGVEAITDTGFTEDLEFPDSDQVALHLGGEVACAETVPSGPIGMARAHLGPN